MRQISAELRLVFHVIKDPRILYEPYLPRNRAILNALRSGSLATAEELLDEYLGDAEEQLTAAYAEAAAR